MAVAERFAALQTKLDEQFVESARLEAVIRANLAWVTPPDRGTP
ncbi:MAG: hypothetical protein WCF85_09645 [Rhodospirillaceae bacterium]